MSTQVFGRVQRDVPVRSLVSSQWAWLGIGFIVAFTVPFLLADVLGLGRDVYYALYALAVAGLFLGWTRETGYDLVVGLTRFR